MNLKKLFVLCCLCAPLYAQAQVKISPKGIRYEILERKILTGREIPAIGDYITLKIYTKNYKDSLINKQNMTDVTLDEAISPIDMRDVVPFMAVGDSAVCYIKVDTFAKYMGREMPNFTPKGTEIKHYIRLAKMEKSGPQRQADAKIIQDYATANGLKIETTKSGLCYVITAQGTGAKAIKGQKVKVHYKGTTLDGKEFDSSYKRSQPFSFKLGGGQVIKGWDEGLALLTMGSKATLLIPSCLAYGKSGAGGGAIPPNSVLRFDVELIDSPSEQKQIADYIAKNQLKTQVTPSGLHYIITKQGTGALPQTGQNVTVHYKGTLLNGAEFDSSYKRNEPFSFNIGMSQVIRGWDEGVALLPVGSIATLIIPSELGYGSRGAGENIPPDSVLKFDIELLGVK